MSDTNALTGRYVEAFGTASKQLPGADLPWLATLRNNGIEQFAELGFPTLRNERWKYTNVRPLTKHNFSLTDQAAVDDAQGLLDTTALTGLDSHRLVFVDGKYAAALSRVNALPDGVVIDSLAAALASGGADLQAQLSQQPGVTGSGFTALNHAFMQDGAVIYVPDNSVIDQPVQLVFLGSRHEQPVWQHPRNVVVAGRNARLTVIESFAGPAGSVYLNNVITSVEAGGNAEVVHYKLQDESSDAFHVATLHVRQQRDSRFTSHSIATGGRLVRNDILVDLDAEGAHCDLFGLYIAGGRQHVDNHTRVEHRKPHGTSRELYKGVLGGRSRAVFNGEVYVHPDAQRTDAEQSNRNLLLSRDAEIDTKPQLEIYADDVKCSHGATVGQLDEQMLYYLRSRGISQSRARGMLTYGFAHDIVDQMDLQPIRESTENLLLNKLPFDDSARGTA